VFAFSALRLTPRQLMPLWVTISLGMALAIGLAGSAPALPCATPWQAALSAMWLSMAIGRCAVVGLYGASVRQLLGTRNRELAQAQNQLHALATRDELTGALNRRAILGALDDALRAGARPSVALMDLDHFKQVNDRHGHLIGSRALCRLAEVLRVHCRAMDTAALTDARQLSISGGAVRLIGDHSMQGGSHEFLGELSRQRTAWNADGDIRAEMRHEIAAQEVGVGDIAEGEQSQTSALDRAQCNHDNATLRHGNGTLIGLHGMHSLEELSVYHHVLGEQLNHVAARDDHEPLLKVIAITFGKSCSGCLDEHRH